MDIKVSSERICQNCGNILDDDDVFCGNCGTKFIEPEDLNVIDEVVVVKEKLLSKTTIFFVFLVIAFLALVVFARSWDNVVKDEAAVSSNTAPIYPATNNSPDISDIDPLTLSSLEQLFSIAKDVGSETFDFESTNTDVPGGYAEMRYSVLAKNNIGVISFRISCDENVSSRIFIYEDYKMDITYEETYRDSSLKSGPVICAAIASGLDYLHSYDLSDFDISARRPTASEKVWMHKDEEPMKDFRNNVKQFYESTIPDVIDAFMSLHNSDITAEDLCFR